MNAEELLSEQIVENINIDDEASEVNGSFKKKKRERLSAVVAGGNSKQYLGKELQLSDIDKMTTEQINKLYCKYEARLGASNMSGLLPFFISIEIKNDNGIDVESLINTANRVIADKAIYKFRVTGEAKIIAIFEVEDDSVVNMVASDIMKRGSFNVTCIPLTSLDCWAHQLGFFPGEILPPQHKLFGKNVVWFAVSLDNHDMSSAKLEDVWKEKVTYMYDQRQKGEIEIEIFKVLGERRLYAFSCKKPYEDWGYNLGKFQIEDNLIKKSKLVTKL
ncbi:unnamed protein product [Mytilus coruscus]|uniref:Uncharacterized protein n=1 Tax=Mytilus coruscus TaxID=42192 RepID=A0A6J8CEK7_MYTCO|nr:unnamed protein product [Mytilus coruscus]